jgi:hypothetical protein
MEKNPIEDIGLIDILPKTEAEESRVWFNSSLKQLGYLFAQRSSEMTENVSWDIIQREDRLTIRALNRIRGRTSNNSIRGKHILSYGAYSEHNRFCENHLYVLDNGEILSVKEQTKISGSDSGDLKQHIFRGHNIIPQSNFKESEQLLNRIIANMNTYLNRPLKYLG